LDVEETEGEKEESEVSIIKRSDLLQGLVELDGGKSGDQFWP
jgi:hypothetical protein